MFSERRSRQVAQTLCDATNAVLWDLFRDAVHCAYPKCSLRTRVGEGKATNCARRGDGNQIVITYGWKMVQSKSSESDALGWLTSREICQRQFFDGEHTLPNLLSHTACHEFAHLIQGTEEGARSLGSVHNLDFYRILRKLHDDGCAAFVREYILERCEAQDIELDWSEAEQTPSREAGAGKTTSLQYFAISAVDKYEWWRDTFVFLAKMDGTFTWLIESLLGKEVREGMDTLLAMIQARPESERENLREVLRKQAEKRRRAEHLPRELRDLIDEECAAPGELF